MNYWILVALFIALGFGGYYYFERKSKSNVDFGNQALQWGSLILGLAIALTIIIVKQFC